MKNKSIVKNRIRNGIPRLVFFGIALVLELLVIILISIWFTRYAEWIAILSRFAATIIVLAIYSQYKTSTLKTPWIVLIIALPAFGVPLYLLIGLKLSTRAMRSRYKTIDDILMPMLPYNENVEKKIRDIRPSLANISRYLHKYSGYPAYGNTSVTYFKDAGEGLEAQLKALSQAKKYIFMEYFAIQEGQAFKRVEEVLVQKVKEGVEVRIFYDDIGSIGYITTDFVGRMKKLGIKCRVFNPVSFIINFFLNHRDHRKYTIIDGNIGFTGGYNLADEYFNITHPFGHWKDTGVQLTGDAVRNLTVSFLEMWNAVNANDIDDNDFSCYLPGLTNEQKDPDVDKGIILPYADTPIDNEQIGENVYISLIEQAVDYIWFITPYLIITDEMAHALSLAAKRGVDVRIVTPGIPDKKMIYQITRSYYHGIAKDGVKIYEYTPGFCHCKMAVTDDIAAVCGTINLDYRSLYHHFENSCLMIDSSAVEEIKNDFTDFISLSKEVTDDYATGRSRFLRVGQLILRFIAPLL